MEIYGTKPTDYTHKTLNAIEALANANNLVLSKWETASRHNQFVRSITYCVHEGEREYRSDRQTGLVWGHLDHPAGKTKRCQAGRVFAKMLSDLIRIIEARESLEPKPKYQLEASGSNTFTKEYTTMTALESELRTSNFPGKLSVVRIDICEEVAFGSQSDVLDSIRAAKKNGFEDLPGFCEL